MTSRYIIRLCELREVISTTEKDEFEKTERRVSALKDGEKILVERTSQLARTRNELQKQTAEYHELNANITLARKDLSRLELAVKKKNLEIEELAARREEERAYHENVLVVRSILAKDGHLIVIMYLLQTGYMYWW